MSAADDWLMTLYALLLRFPQVGAAHDLAGDRCITPPMRS